MRPLARAIALLSLASMFGCRFCQDPVVVEPLAAVIARCGMANGDVRRRPAQRTAWDSLAEGADLSRGDWVQTAQEASARIDFASGLRLDVQQGSLVVIEERLADNDAPIDVGGPSSRVAVVSGSIRATIAKDAKSRSVVVATADGREVRLEAKAEAGDLDYQATVKDGAIELQVLKGAAKVRGVAGAERALEQGQATEISREGKIAEPSRILPPPEWLAPEDGAFVTWQPGLKLDLRVAQVEGAAGYVLEMTRGGAAPVQLETVPGNLSAELTHLGTYRLKAATRNSRGVVGSFGAPRMLHAVTDRIEDRLETPPDGAVVGVERGNPLITFRWRPSDPPARYRLVVSPADRPGEAAITQETDATELSTRALDPGQYRWVVHVLRGDLAVPLFRSPRTLAIRRARSELRVPARLEWGKGKGRR